MVDSKSDSASNAQCDFDPINWAANWIRLGGIEATKHEQRKGRIAQGLAKTLISNRRLYAHADASLLDAHNAYAFALKRGRVTLSPIENRNPIMGRINIIQLLLDSFDAVVAELFPVYSNAWYELLVNQVVIPLKHHVRALDDCQIVSQKITNTIAHFDNLAVENLDWPQIEICRIQSNLELLADTFRATYLAFSLPSIRWCQVCFRRVGIQERYCRLHKPLDVKGGDTEYRKARRISDKTIKIYAQSWAKHRSLRVTFGDDIQLISDDNEVMHLQRMECVFVDKDITDLCIRTTNSDWNSACMMWSHVLDCCPEVQNQAQIKAEEFDSWDSFRRTILRSLNNDYETTNHPYWILLMLAEAEEWLCIERKRNDERCSGTGDEVKLLHFRNPELSQGEIARRLGISRQRVSAIFKLL